MNDFLTKLVSVFNSFDLTWAESAVLAVIVVLALGIAVLLIMVGLLLRRWQRLTGPVYEREVAEAKAEAKRIRQRAQEQAETTQAEAVRQAGEYLTQARAEADQLNQQFSQKLEQLTEQLIDRFKQIDEQIKNQTESLPDQAAGVITQAGDRAAGELKSVVDHFREQTDQQISRTGSALEEAEQVGRRQLAEKFDQELTRAREEIGRYKENRLRLVDEHITTLVEKATQLTLGQSLSGEAHAEIIKQALKEAKNSTADSTGPNE